MRQLENVIRTVMLDNLGGSMLIFSDVVMRMWLGKEYPCSSKMHTETEKDKASKCLKLIGKRERLRIQMKHVWRNVNWSIE